MVAAEDNDFKGLYTCCEGMMQIMFGCLRSIKAHDLHSTYFKNWALAQICDT